MSRAQGALGGWVLERFWWTLRQPEVDLQLLNAYEPVPAGERQTHHVVDVYAEPGKPVPLASKWHVAAHMAPIQASRSTTVMSSFSMCAAVLVLQAPTTTSAGRQVTPQPARLALQLPLPVHRSATVSAVACGVSCLGAQWSDCKSTVSFSVDSCGKSSYSILTHLAQGLSWSACLPSLCNVCAGQCSSLANCCGPCVSVVATVPALPCMQEDNLGTL